MAFDEQLRRAFDTLSDHLRDELTRQVAALHDELAGTAAAEREQAVADARREHDVALADARGRHDSALADLQKQHDAALAAAEADREAALAAARAEHEAALEAAARERDAALSAAGQEHDLAVETARAEAADAAREQARKDAEQDVAARIANATAVAEALGRDHADAEAKQRVASLEAQLRDAEQRAQSAQEESRRTLERAATAARSESRAGDASALERLLDGVRAIDRARSLSEILDTLIGCAGREAARAGVLLARGGQLRGWSFIGLDGNIERGSEIRYADAGIVAEAARSGQTCTADPASAPAPRFAALGAGRPAVAVPLALAGQVVAVLYADQGANIPDGGAHDGSARWVEAIELLARHATSALEAVTAFKAARALVDSPGAAPGTGGNASDDQEAARRYARLLVSEIKLYHEAEVLAGRRDRNITARLGAQIERARALYNERVPALVREDHFHAELVRTLASGDPSLLGEVKA